MEQNNKTTKNIRLIVGATGYYIQWVTEFCKHAFNLLGLEDENNTYCYRITVITDKSDKKYSDLEASLLYIKNNKDKYHLDDIRITNCPAFPWPVITLYKPFLCEQYIEDDDDIVYCGNVNIEMQPNNGSWYKNDKVNVSWHHKHPEPYYNSRPYYIQGGFVCAEREIMRNFCTEWQSKINWHINSQHEVPDWHDETCLNELFNERRSAFNPNFILYVDSEDSERMTGQFAKLKLEGKRDSTFKTNW